MGPAAGKQRTSGVRGGSAAAAGTRAEPSVRAASAAALDVTCIPSIRITDNSSPRGAGQFAKRRILTFRMSPNPISVAMIDDPP